MRNFREGNRGAGFNRNRSSGSGGRFGGRRRDRDSDRRSSEMHNVVCSKCGSRCQVPFKPTGSKPVFCSDCFRQNENEGSNRGFRSNSNDAGQSDQLKQINAKLDKILLVLQDLEIDTSEDSEDDAEEDSERD